MFEVINPETKEVVAVYHTPQAANEHVEWHLSCHNKKLRIKKRPIDANWKEREAKKLTDGTYEPLPDWWLNADWWINSEYSKRHFAHRVGRTKIGFTRTDHDGKLNIQSHLSVTRYLGQHTSLYGDEISDIYGKLIGESLTLRFGHSPEEFEKVFEGQPVCAEDSSYESCMRYNRSHFNLNNHPAYVYGAGDLAVAYIEDEDADNFTVLARAVVYPAEKTFIRVYGLNETYKSALISKLKDEGYSRARSFDDARLLKVPHDVPDDKEYDYYIMPYVDGRNYVIEQEDSFIITSNRCENNYFCDATEGVIKLYKQIKCAKSGKLTRNYVTVWVSKDTQEIWDSDIAAKANLTRCNLSREYVIDEALLTPYKNHEDIYFGLKRYFADYSIHRCAITNEITSTQEVITKEGKIWVSEDLCISYRRPEDHHKAAFCVMTGKFYLLSDFEFIHTRYDSMVCDPNKYGNNPQTQETENVF